MTSQLSRENDSTIERLRSGGVPALAELFSRERNRLNRMIDARLDRALAARLDSSDIVQETFVAASRLLETYLANPRLPPFLWLRGLARKVLMVTRRDHHAAEMRDPAREVRENPDNRSRLLVDQLAVSMPSPRSQVAQDAQDEISRNCRVCH